MYERFTDRARKVMQLANQEAQRFNHEYIGTEHILLGLVKEGSGVAANVLKNLDIDLKKLRCEVEKIIAPGSLECYLGKLPQTPKAKKVIEYAIEEARNLEHNYVGTEHLLLGLLREGEGVAAQVLKNLRLKLEDVRNDVIQILGFNIAAQESGNCPHHPEASPPCAAVDYLTEMDKEDLYKRFTDSARKVMHWADKEAVRSNHELITTDHLLLGLLKEGSGIAARVLMNFGLDVVRLRVEIAKIVPAGPAMVVCYKRPLTSRLKKVIENAIEEARNLNHNYVGTEHLLLGLIREQEGVAAQVFINLGLSTLKLREEVLNLLGHQTTIERKNGELVVRIPRPLMCEAQQTISQTENQAPSTANEIPPSPERERIRSLEQQLWNVRVLLGALVGTLAGVLLFTSLGAVIGLFVGGVVAALGWRSVGMLAGGGAGALLGSAHLTGDGGGFAGALLGALAGFLIADIGRYSER
jgi:ATP-dependent Clp protease ATP-binding subunit ClpA